MMSLRRPGRGFTSERPRLIERHLGRHRLHRDRSGMKGDVRIGELVIAIVAAKLFAPSRAPGEHRGSIEMGVFRRGRLDCCGRRHRLTMLRIRSESVNLGVAASTTSRV